MPVEVRRDKIIRLLESGTQLVEVLSSRQYEEIHLARAVSLPLREMDRESAGRLDATRLVITYCYDHWIRLNRFSEDRILRAF